MFGAPRPRSRGGGGGEETFNLLITRQVLVCYMFQGRIQDFHGGGGKKLYVRTHITSVEPDSLSAGAHGSLKGPGSARVVLTLGPRAI